MELIEQIYPNLGVISLLVAIFFGIMTIYFYYHPQKQKIPCFAIKNFNLIRNLGKKFENIQMRYGTDPIDNFSATKIAFWNGGKDTIKYDRDIAPADPLIIKIADGKKILDAEKIFEKNPINRFNVEISADKSHVKLFFDYIDKNDGVVIQILHTGTRASDIKLYGTVEGVKKIICTNCINPDALLVKSVKKISPIMDSVSSTWKKRIKGFIFIVMPIIMLFLLASTPTGIKTLFDIFLILIITIPYWFMAYITLKRKIPAGFEIFDEEI